jgi:hypothetical protein
MGSEDAPDLGAIRIYAQQAMGQYAGISLAPWAVLAMLDQIDAQTARLAAVEHVILRAEELIAFGEPWNGRRCTYCGVVGVSLGPPLAHSADCPWRRLRDVLPTLGCEDCAARLGETESPCFVHRVLEPPR